MNVGIRTFRDDGNRYEFSITPAKSETRNRIGALRIKSRTCGTK